jgi:Amt family ammonium transporter
VRVDDPCGAFAVHGACGIFGTLSLGLFAVGNYGDVKGLLYGGDANQLIAQVKGSATIIAATAPPDCSSCSG